MMEEIFKKYVFDIDQTILESVRHDDGNYEILSRNVNLINIINKLYKAGNIIVIETARHWNLLNQTIEQLKDNGVKYTTLVMGGPVADFYINDKAVSPEKFIKMMEEDNE